MIKVFYDGKCGLCHREINYYRRIAHKDTFNWVDINQHPQSLGSFGISFNQTLKHLHSIDNHGNVKCGVDTFILMWKNLPYWKGLAYFVSLPVIYPLTNKLYNVFAKWRFKRLTYCDV